jgi:pimeloyl-ACP methyl ester carboxylesterase
MDLNNLQVNHSLGSGEQNFILIHNAGGSHLMFKHQIDLLLQYGDVYQFDLPGHGLNKASPLDSDLVSCASLVTKIVAEYQLKKTCLIGLNNGADIALQAYSCSPTLFNMLIMIDPPIMMTNDFIHEIQKFIIQLDNLDSYEYFINQMINSLLPYSDSKIRDIAKKSFLSVDKNALKNMFSSLITWDKGSREMLAKVDVPTLCILTDEHHCSYQKIQSVAPQILLAKTVGSHCWATLDAPEQVNAMISRFLNMKIIK